MTEYNDEICYKYWDDIEGIKYRHIKNSKVVDICQSNESAHIKALYGKYEIVYKDIGDHIHLAYIGTYGTYVIMGGIKYEINEDVLGKINMILYNRNMEEAIERL